MKRIGRFRWISALLILTVHLISSVSGLFSPVVLAFSTGTNLIRLSTPKITLSIGLLGLLGAAPRVNCSSDSQQLHAPSYPIPSQNLSIARANFNQNSNNATSQIRIYAQDQDDSSEYYELPDSSYQLSQDAQNLTYVLMPGESCSLITCGLQTVWSKGNNNMLDPRSIIFNDSQGSIVISDIQKSLYYNRDGHHNWSFTNESALQSSTPISLPEPSSQPVNEQSQSQPTKTLLQLDIDKNIESNDMMFFVENKKFKSQTYTAKTGYVFGSIIHEDIKLWETDYQSGYGTQVAATISGTTGKPKLITIYLDTNNMVVFKKDKQGYWSEDKKQDEIMEASDSESDISFDDPTPIRIIDTSAHSNQPKPSHADFSYSSSEHSSDENKKFGQSETESEFSEFEFGANKSSEPVPPDPQIQVHDVPPQDVPPQQVPTADVPPQQVPVVEATAPRVAPTPVSSPPAPKKPPISAEKASLAPNGIRAFASKHVDVPMWTNTSYRDGAIKYPILNRSLSSFSCGEDCRGARNPVDYPGNASRVLVY